MSAKRKCGDKSQVDGHTLLCQLPAGHEGLHESWNYEWHTDPAVEDAPRENCPFCGNRLADYDKPIDKAEEDATPPTCEHGVLAGGHCSVCGTLSSRSQLFSHVPQSRSHATPRTPLRELAEQWLSEHKKNTGWSAYDLFSLIRLLKAAATTAGPTIREVCKGRDDA